MILVGGFGNAGQPVELLNVITQIKPRDSAIFSNSDGSRDAGIGQLILGGRVKLLICSFPGVTGVYEEGKLE